MSAHLLTLVFLAMRLATNRATAALMASAAEGRRHHVDGALEPVLQVQLA
jgi:hypothetical protein